MSQLSLKFTVDFMTTVVCFDELCLNLKDYKMDQRTKNSLDSPKK